MDIDLREWRLITVIRCPRPNLESHGVASDIFSATLHCIVGERDGVLDLGFHTDGYARSDVRKWFRHVNCIIDWWNGGTTAEANGDNRK